MHNNMEPQKIITTKRNMKYVMHGECLICKEQDFSFDFVNHLVVCNNCNTLYAISIIGIINLFDKYDGIVRVYNKDIILIDDEEKEFEICTKKIRSLTKRKNKTSDR